MLTLKEAGKALGLSRETLRKAILAGDLPAIPTSGPGGKTYLVDLDQAQAWLERRLGAMGAVAGAIGSPLGTVVTPFGAVATVGTPIPAPDRLEEPTITTRSHSVPLVAHLAALEQGSRLIDQIATLQGQLDQERATREQAIRRADLLAYELTHHRRALSEAAESLAEQRAATLTSEAQRLAMELTTATAEQRLADLANAAQLVDHQAEPKIDTTRPAARGWGSRIKGFLLRKIG